ncbi:hypothetical protein GCM10022220_53080 [Actinocatenispora rupis]|uniref:Uncharacterized protein n=1 Tax=Actinocatenispora rupis TaxID=519421 RepID=A0A8J3IZE7_9ACTN|nr:hypothetical protein Aru02nite_00790 [Actinocatenispora rupis]
MPWCRPTGKTGDPRPPAAGVRHRVSRRGFVMSGEQNRTTEQERDEERREAQRALQRSLESRW